jgi:hypothetical protein
MKSWPWLLLLVPLLAGCPIGNNKYPKPRDLKPGWLIDRLRVLAIKAEPPEITPGEEARFEALVVDPKGVSGAIVWIACEPDDEGNTSYGCGLNADFDFTEATPEELAEAGFIGFEPLIPARYLSRSDALDNLEGNERTEGVQVLIQIAVLPEEAMEEGFEGGAFDFNEVEVAYKRLIVSEAPTPNHNPEIANFLIDGVPVDPDAVVEVDPEQQYEVGAQLAEGTVELYTYEDEDGAQEEREEQPYIRWYTDAGDMLEDATLYPYLDATWEAPAADAEQVAGTWWAVIRDRRGGISWGAQRWRLRGSDLPATP